MTTQPEDRGRRPLCRLLGDERGATAVMLAVLLVPLIAFVGLSVDTARAYFLKARLNQAIDAAALAGGRVFFETDRNQDVKDFFAANFPDGFMGSTVSPLTINADPIEGSIEVMASATMETTFLTLVGQSSITVSARTVVQRAERGMELVLVMDNTGSMSTNNRIGNMRSAAHELVSILYGSKTSIPDFYVSIVPYAATVNVGDANDGWLATGAIDQLTYEYPESEVSSSNCRGSGTDFDHGFDACTVGTKDTRTGLSQADCEAIGIWNQSTQSCLVADGWNGCVMARSGGNDLTDTSPTAAPFSPFHWERYTGGSSSWMHNRYLPSRIRETSSSGARGPNRGCVTEVRPHLTARGDVDEAIDDMVSHFWGYTHIPLGLVWGWRLLSPDWRGLWGNVDLPLDYDEPLSDKVVVLLTDGINTADSNIYTAYGWLADGALGTTTTQATASLNQKLSTICTAMKNEGIVIYAITFEVPESDEGRTIRTLFENCATSPGHYFNSYGGGQLNTAFRTIANQLSNLRIRE